MELVFQLITQSTGSQWPELTTQSTVYDDQLTSQWSGYHFNYSSAVGNLLNDSFVTSGEHLSNDSVKSTEKPKKVCNDSLELYRYVITVWLTLPMSVIGIVGNILALIVLCRQKHGASTNLILQGLAVADILYLLCCILLTSMKYIYKCTILLQVYKTMHKWLMVTAYPISFEIRIVCTWLTALLTFNRWVAVCRPLHAQRIVTRRNTAIQLFCTVVVALLVGAPKFTEYTLNLRKNSYYVIIYSGFVVLLILYVLPMVILAIFNLKLMKALSISNKKFNSLQQQHPSLTQSNARKSVTVLVLVVTTLFIVCNSLSLVSHILHYTYIAWKSARKPLQLPNTIISNLANLLLVINSAVNFIIYCVCSKNFRKTFVDMFKPAPKKIKSIESRSSKRTTRFTPITYLSLTRTRSSSSSAHDKLKNNEHFS